MIGTSKMMQNLRGSAKVARNREGDGKRHSVDDGEQAKRVRQRVMGKARDTAWMTGKEGEAEGDGESKRYSEGGGERE